MGFIEFSENDDGIKDLPDDATETLFTFQGLLEEEVIIVG